MRVPQITAANPPSDAVHLAGTLISPTASHVGCHGPVTASRASLIFAIAKFPTVSRSICGRLGIVGRNDAIDDRRPVELELGLAGGGERRAFLVADADPFDVAAANRIGERIERVADQSEDVLDPDLFEHANQDACYRLGHRRLLAHRHQSCSALYLGVGSIIASRYFVVA